MVAETWHWASKERPNSIVAGRVTPLAASISTRVAVPKSLAHTNAEEAHSLALVVDADVVLKVDRIGTGLVARVAGRVGSLIDFVGSNVSACVRRADADGYGDNEGGG